MEKNSQFIGHLNPGAKQMLKKSRELCRAWKIPSLLTTFSDHIPDWAAVSRTSPHHVRCHQSAFPLCDEKFPNRPRWTGCILPWCGTAPASSDDLVDEESEPLLPTWTFLTDAGSFHVLIDNSACVFWRLACLEDSCSNMPIKRVFPPYIENLDIMQNPHTLLTFLCRRMSVWLIKNFRSAFAFKATESKTCHLCSHAKKWSSILVPDDYIKRF